MLIKCWLAFKSVLLFALRVPRLQIGRERERVVSAVNDTTFPNYFVYNTTWTMNVSCSLRAQLRVPQREVVARTER